MNALFPVVGRGLDLAGGAALAGRGRRPASAPFEATALTFAGTLLTLAILEHWFMVLPLPSAGAVELGPALARPTAGATWHPAS